MNRYATVYVRCRLPQGVDADDFRDYVADAVFHWCGQFEPPHDDSPGDPRRYINESITVRGRGSDPITMDDFRAHTE